ncbi:hypothetical protein B0J11DRAFT_54875 [Dendryphion nanum]|uniref:C2H2-type domain-containing protein n=1 Tax=Dendryphion nanum TaxID=256645 RepID=A0A9P9DLD0_9PLEO|nr:hypothetical protein B0J11DRAFT_54875 [Dendryphion nanum]
MEDFSDFPEESMRHVEALLNRHPPQVVLRMFQQVMDSKRNSMASASSYTTSSNSSMRSSRLSVASTFSTSTNFSTSTTGSSEIAPSIASSTSSRSRSRRTEPRSYPSGLDPTRPKTHLMTPTSEDNSPLDAKFEPVFTPTEEEMASNASPITFQSEKSLNQSNDSFMFCTYCAELSVQKTFKAKSDWKKHEMRMHETGEDWPCPVPGCSRIFDRQKDFVRHHVRYHSGRPLPSVTDIGIRLLPRRVFGCGFDKCKDVSIGWDERCDHVAKHMKNGSTSDQWKYSNVIRNLIRQEALHDTWKELFASLDERLREHRSQITWSPDNTRTLRQKLQCCDLRPSREEVLITALSLRSDLPLDTSQLGIPPGFTTPSRDSVPNVDQLSREQRMHILIGNPVSLSRTRLAAVHGALLKAINAIPGFGAYVESPVLEEPSKRISYMDLDTADFTMNDPEIPAIPQNPPNPPLPPPSHHPHTPHTPHTPLTPMQADLSHETAFADPGRPSPAFVDPGKPSNGYVEPVKPVNPLGWCYPNYFDPAPTFEESHYYERPSTFGQMLSRPLHKIGNRLGSRHSSPHSRPSSAADHHDFVIPMQQQQMGLPTSQPQQSQQQQYNHMNMRQQYRTPDDQHPQLHLFTPQG